MNPNGLAKNIFTIAAASLLLAACATTETETEVETVEETEATTPAVPTPDVSQTTVSPGPAPGTQAHLVATVGDRIFFDFDKSELKPQARETLRRQAEWLRNNPEVDVMIEGHCDERGTREYNLALGERRAVAVRNYLVALGISSDRLNTISYGKERPVAFGHNEDAWAKNRRSVMVVL